MNQGRYYFLIRTVLSHTQTHTRIYIYIYIYIYTNDNTVERSFNNKSNIDNNKNTLLEYVYINYR